MDPIQIKTLDFILAILAPILQMFSRNIERERIVSIVKHEMFNPLKMSKDLVMKNLTRFSQTKDLDGHFFHDLSFCLLTATNFVRNLEQSPTSIQEFEARAIQLESDIIIPITKMLTRYAELEANISITHTDFKQVFPDLIYVDKELVSAALVNVIVNAVKYGKSGSTITLYAREDDIYFNILVKNVGIRINANEKIRIFEYGYRSPEASMKKILFIDDDRYFMSEQLEELKKHFIVEECFEAKDAVQKIINDKDFVGSIVDVMMPPPNGFENETNDGNTTGVWILEQ